MIPLRLTVKNFMCYADDVPTLDVEGVHVACLCGDNGHGKTALLDAITWALWGNSRARTQEELVHQGQQDMAVELDFLARDQRYRVSRRHSRSARSRQGTTILELQVASRNGFQPITGNSVRDTEAQIRDILNMDYDTFVNTAFLRQGDADRFTTSVPSARKETLAEVLGLSYYRGMEERAKVQSRSIQDEITGVEKEIDWRQQETSRRPEHQRQLASAKAELALITPETETQQKVVEELRRKLDALQRQRLDLDELSRSLADAQKEIVHLESQARNHEARIAHYQSALERQAEIKERFAELVGSRADLERLDQALGHKSKLDKEMADLEREVAVQKERLTAQAAQLRQRIVDDLEPKAKRMPEIEERLRTVAREQADLAQLEQAHSQQRDQAQETAARFRYLEETNAALLKEMKDGRQKFDMLVLGESLCPLCKHPLGADGQEHLRREYEDQGLQRQGQYRENESERKALDRRRGELTSAVARLDNEVQKRRRAIESAKARLERDRAESEKAQSELRQAIPELERADSFMNTDTYAVAERKRLVQLEAEEAALGYEADKHGQVREQVKGLAGYEELHRRLQEALERLPLERNALESARQILERRQRRIREDEERKHAMEEELKSLSSLKSQLEDARARYDTLHTQREEALVKRGVLEQQLQRCDALDSEVHEYERRRRKLVDDKSIYDELAVAFGKNGIQTLIIETAIPQLEADANELLGRLTENRMFLKLQLQEGRRDSRTGLPTEELDIKIADEVGTRSYETFSGGEAFRINFALRIALSKLLARRSGAPLPILFIDEGFGSQDSSGQERLLEAIQSIQDDFEKIIVITHIEQIKEAFPVRIEVTKTGLGSTFEVV